MNKNIILLWQGQLISQLGMQAYSIAMMFWFMENTNSSILMSIILTLSILPSVILGPIAGVIADQYSRKNIMIVTDLIRGVAVLIISLIIFSEYGSQIFVIILFAIVSLINGISKAFFQPAVDAFIPDLVTTKRLPNTIAFFQTSTQCTTIVGQVIGGLLYKTLGAPALLLLDAISYFISAFSESFIKHNFQKKKGRTSFRYKYRQHKADLIEGLVYIKSCKGMLQTMIFASSINFFIAPIMLLLPFYVTGQLLEEAHWYGFLLASMALGSICGYWLSATCNIKGKRRAFIMFSSMFLFSSSLMLLSQTETSQMALLGLFIAGLSLGGFNLQAITLFQKNTSTELRGRVMSLLMTISNGLLPLGLLIGGILGSLTNNNTQLIFLVCSFSIGLITVFYTFNLNVKGYMFNDENTQLITTEEKNS